ncbi:MAG: hypothetical protein HY899_01570 [Deltaproteobacteria bacterium]|nr:hypothetical protein [Deltaproteobacteria bacterium]
MIPGKTKTALAVASAMLVVTAAQARAEVTHVLKQVTALTVGRIEEPNIRQMDGDYITFVSDGDVMGPGTEHLGQREVYLWSRQGDSVTQVTHTIGGESYDASRVTDDYGTKRAPAIVFVSTGDLDPAGGNADGNPEVFVWQMDTGAFLQLTDTPPGVVNAAPVPSDTGSCVLFQSSGDLDDNDGSFEKSVATGFENADGSLEMFYLDFHDLTFEDFHVTQISNGPAGTTSSHGSAGGYFFALECSNQTYQSDYDQLGEGISGVNVYEHRKRELKRERLSVGAVAGGASIEPRMAGTGLVTGGPSVVFSSNADLRHNGSTGFHIYKSAIHTQRQAQLTADPGGVHTRPSISDGSRTVVFESTGEAADPAKSSRRGPDGPHNADGNSEIVRIMGRHKVQMVTRTTGCNNDQASIMGNGRGVAFRSDCDLIAGENALGAAQVFAYYEAYVRETYSAPADCSIADACCSTANGCYELTLGTAPRIPPRIR